MHMYQLTQEEQRLMQPLREYAQARRDTLSLSAEEMADAIAEKAKDKRIPGAYSRETMERNSYDIFGKENRQYAETLNEQYFTPVQRACVSNGIRMEVAACFVHDDTAELYVTLQDLEGDRVDETTDLFDSYTIRQPYDTAATCSLVHYDASTGTAVFQIQITR